MNPAPPSRGRNISPLSTDSTDSSFALRYQNFGGANSPFGAEHPGRKPSHTSPPTSQHHSGSTDNSLSSRPSNNRSASNTNSHVSSASSVARSSEGNGMYSPALSESGALIRPGQEEALQEHYNVFKGFLASYLKDENGNSSKTKAKAKDKLLRLSVSQFQELSTDVFDELLRREDDRLRRVPNVPRSLPPKTVFHPKRNQARQKLSTLPLEKFVLLCTDVFYELERRVPRFTGAEIDRVASPAVSVASSQRAPSRGGMHPNGMRGPPLGPGGLRGPPPPGARSPTAEGPSPYQAQSLRGSSNGPHPGSGQRSNSETSNNDLGRPLPKTFQSNTIIPNKSTMVEDDESDEEDETFGLEKVINSMGRGSVGKTSEAETDRTSSKVYETQISELHGTIASLEEKLRTKEADHENLEADYNKLQAKHHELGTSTRERSAGLDSERDGWSQTRQDLERQLTQAHDLAESFRNQLEHSRQTNSQTELDLRKQMDHTVSELEVQINELTADNDRLRHQPLEEPESDGGEWRERHQELQDQLADQQRLTDDVRHQATQFLQEMRMLSEQSEAALGKEELLRSQVSSLEAELQEWKSRYANAKTQLRTLKASSIGLPLNQGSSSALAARQELMSESGLVNDVDVTKFQMSIEELVHAARDAPSETVLERMKDVVYCVRAMTAGDGSEAPGLASPILSGSMSIHPETNAFSPATPKGRVLIEAKQLITAARNYVSANGLSPVSLLDAAAGNLTAAMVEYLRQAGIKPTPSSELHSGDDDDYTNVTSVPSATEDSPPAAKNTPPKTNGWFARLKGGMDNNYGGDNTGKSTQQYDDDDDEYDPYR